MTVKTLNIQTLSIRPQNDTEKVILDNMKNLLLTKKAKVFFNNDGDMIIEITNKED